MSEDSNESLVSPTEPIQPFTAPADLSRTDTAAIAEITGVLPGAELARQREARGWTIPEVADQLNLAARQITALESDDYAALPGIAIVRGFIRAYAKLLKIDPAPLLATMPANPTASLVEPMPQRRALPHAHFSEPRLNGSTYGGNSSKWYSMLLLLVALIGAIALAQHFDVLPGDIPSITAKLKARFGGASTDTATAAQDNRTEASSDTVVVNALPDPVVNVGNSGKSVVIPNANFMPPATAPAAVSTPVAPATPVIDASLAPAATPAEKANAVALRATDPSQLALNAATTLAKVPATGDSANQLVLTLRDDSWIEIRGTRSTVASQLYRAGATQTFDITEPVQLIVGNAAGVDATLRGAPLVLQTSAKNNVARLNLK